MWSDGASKDAPIGPTNKYNYADSNRNDNIYYGSKSPRRGSIPENRSVTDGGA
jgi:hypothetical protein